MRIFRCIALAAGAPKQWATVALLLSFSLAASSFAAEEPPKDHLTDQDRERIQGLQTDAATKTLVSGLVSFIRSEAAKNGVDPTKIFGGAPNGEDDREYRLKRLKRLQQMRENSLKKD